MSTIRYCPEHGSPEDPFTAWPCPMAVEGDPPETETCPHLVEELARRIDDVTVHGNYFQYHEIIGDDGHRIRTIQEYRNHRPYGEPRQGWII